MSLVQSNVRSGRYHYDIGYIAALLHFHVFFPALFFLLFLIFAKSMRVSVGISILNYFMS